MEEKIQKFVLNLGETLGKVINSWVDAAINFDKFFFESFNICSQTPKTLQ